MITGWSANFGLSFERESTRGALLDCGVKAGTTRFGMFVRVFCERSVEVRNRRQYAAGAIGDIPQSVWRMGGRELGVGEGRAVGC